MVTDLGRVNLEELISRLIPSQRLDDYHRLLMEHNQRVNLVSRETDRAAFERMVGESLLPFQQIPTQARDYLDIGAGGGIPAIPLMLAGLVSAKAILVERTGKKARALEMMVEQLGLSAEVIQREFAEISRTLEADLITLRYVKLNSTLLAIISQTLLPGGYFVYYGPPLSGDSRLKTEAFSFRSSQDSAVKSFTIFKK